MLSDSRKYTSTHGTEYLPFVVDAVQKAMVNGILKKQLAIIMFYVYNVPK